MSKRISGKVIPVMSKGTSNEVVTITGIILFIAIYAIGFFIVINIGVFSLYAESIKNIWNGININRELHNIIKYTFLITVIIRALKLTIFI